MQWSWRFFWSSLVCYRKIALESVLVSTGFEPKPTLTDLHRNCLQFYSYAFSLMKLCRYSHYEELIFSHLNVTKLLPFKEVWSSTYSGACTIILKENNSHSTYYAEILLKVVICHPCTKIRHVNVFASRTSAYLWC